MLGQFCPWRKLLLLSTGIYFCSRQNTYYSRYASTLQPYIIFYFSDENHQAFVASGNNLYCKLKWSINRNFLEISQVFLVFYSFTRIFLQFGSLNKTKSWAVISGSRYEHLLISCHYHGIKPVEIITYIFDLFLGIQSISYSFKCKFQTLS